MWPLATSKAQCAAQGDAEKCINVYNGQNKKALGHMTDEPCKNLHTAVSINKPKQSVSKHDQTVMWVHTYIIQADMLQTQRS